MQYASIIHYIVNITKSEKEKVSVLLQKAFLMMFLSHAVCYINTSCPFI